jgi:thiamine-phosphate pyrophosphorylase
MEIDADGLHVGGTDISVAEARAQIGADKILGASCYGDMQLARTAAATGASYIAFGGFYPSRIKKYAVTTPADIVSDAGKEFDLPRVVIGGMTLQNCQSLIANGRKWSRPSAACIWQKIRVRPLPISVACFEHILSINILPGVYFEALCLCRD